MAGDGSNKDDEGAAPSMRDRQQITRVKLPSSTKKDWIINDIKIGNVVAPPLPSNGEIVVDPHMHCPAFRRTLGDFPGNRTSVCGCMCGADVRSNEAYAEHVGWPIEAVRAVCALAGFADDLVRRPEYREKIPRSGVWEQVGRYLEVRR